jgi:hypothetical protein
MFKAYYEDTGQHHPHLLARPPLRSDCTKYLDAYRLLSGSRMWDEVGPKPISVAEVESLVDMAGVEGEEARMKYLRLMRRMDLTELQILRERLQQHRARASK